MREMDMGMNGSESNSKYFIYFEHLELCVGN